MVENSHTGVVRMKNCRSTVADGSRKQKSEEDSFVACDVSFASRFHSRFVPFRSFFFIINNFFS